MQSALRHIVIWLYDIFSTFSQKREDFRKLLNTKCAFWFPLHLLSETYLIIRRIEQDVLDLFIGLHVKYALFLSSFNETWIFSTNFRKNSGISDFHENPVQWEPNCCMRAGGQKWWSNSAKAPDNSNSLNTPCAVCGVPLCSKLVRYAH